MEESNIIYPQSRLPSIQISTLPHTCPVKQKLPLLKKISLGTGRHSTIPGPRFQNDLASPQPGLRFKHEDIKLVSLTPRSKNRATFGKSSKWEHQSQLLEDKISNPQYCKAKDNQNTPRNNEKYSKNPNKHKPSRYASVNDQKSTRKPQLYEEIKGLEKSLGGILEFKVNRLRDEQILEKIYRFAPSKNHDSY